MTPDTEAALTEARDNRRSRLDALLNGGSAVVPLADAPVEIAASRSAVDNLSDALALGI